MNSLVSIIIPTLNRAAVIEETLYSVLSQNYDNWECLIVDDGSKDDTEKVMLKWCRKDSRIQYFKRPECRRQGAASCRNYGFQISRGNYVQWLDSDDLLDPNKLFAQVQNLKEEKEKTIAICKFGYLRATQETSFLRENIGFYKDFKEGKDLLSYFGIHKEYLPVHTYLTPKTLILESGLWNEDLSINDDGEFFTRVLLNTRKVKFVETGVYYRMRSQDSISQIDSEKKAQETVVSWKIIKDHINNQLKVDKHPYVEAAKQIMLKNFNKNYPEVVYRNYEFFKSVLPLYKRLLKKIS